MSGELTNDETLGNGGGVGVPDAGAYSLVPGRSVRIDSDGVSRRVVDALWLRHSGKAGWATRVMDVLYKYPYLDRISIKAALAGRDGSEIADGKLYDALRLLRDGGIVTRLEYADYSFYALSAASRECLAPSMRYRVSVLPEGAPDAEVLALAGLCRWHAHAVSGGDVGLNFVRQKMRIAREDYLPDSYVEFSRSVKYRLFAFPVPRDGSFSPFRDRILDSWRLQAASLRRGQASLTLLVAPSLASAQACAEIFSRDCETRGRTIYYALDSRCGPQARGFGGICSLDAASGTLTSVGIR